GFVLGHAPPCRLRQTEEPWCRRQASWGCLWPGTEPTRGHPVEKGDRNVAAAEEPVTRLFISSQPLLPLTLSRLFLLPASPLSPRSPPLFFPPPTGRFFRRVEFGQHGQHRPELRVPVFAFLLRAAFQHLGQPLGEGRPRTASGFCRLEPGVAAGL